MVFECLDVLFGELLQTGYLVDASSFVDVNAAAEFDQSAGGYWWRGLGCFVGSCAEVMDESVADVGADVSQEEGLVPGVDMQFRIWLEVVLGDRVLLCGRPNEKVDRSCGVGTGIVRWLF